MIFHILPIVRDFQERLIEANKRADFSDIARTNRLNVVQNVQWWGFFIDAPPPGSVAIRMQ
jgi:hypothetical protein